MTQLQQKLRAKGYNISVDGDFGPNTAAAVRPGYSNHQGGIAADINMPGGYGGSTYRWLSSHARAYGFVNDVGGEPWHWTYRG